MGLLWAFDSVLTTEKWGQVKQVLEKFLIIKEEHKDEMSPFAGVKCELELW
jgi:hypothetical protein